MSGAQPKAGNIAGVVSITAEINPKAAIKSHEQGWVDEITDDVDKAIDMALECKEKKEPHSIAYLGNIVDLWERLGRKRILKLNLALTKLPCIIHGQVDIILWDYLMKNQI